MHARAPLASHQGNLHVVSDSHGLILGATLKRQPGGRPARALPNEAMHRSNFREEALLGMMAVRRRRREEASFFSASEAWEPTGAPLGPVGKEARSTILKTRMFTTERPMPGPLQEAFAHTQLIWSCPQGSAQLFFPNLLLFLRPGSAPQEVQVLWGALESVSCLLVLDSATYTPQSEHNGKSRLSECSVADSF